MNFVYQLFSHLSHQSFYNKNTTDQGWGLQTIEIPSLKKLFYLFIFGCAESLLVLKLLSTCDQLGLLLSCSGQASRCFSGFFPCCRAGAVQRLGSSSCGASSQQLRLPASGAQAQQLRCMGLTAPQHVGFVSVRDRTHASCIVRRIFFLFFFYH